MEYTKIQYNNHVIFKKHIPFDYVKEAINEVEINKKYFYGDLEYLDDLSLSVGMQIPCDIITSDHLLNLFQTCYKTTEKICSNFLNRDILSGYQSNWVYISVPSSPSSNYHKHPTLSNYAYTNIYTDYTWVYYLQIPNNCVEDEGKLFFKDKISISENEAFKLFPEVETLYIFDANLPHRPELSPNSDVDRIVLGGNIVFNF
jgi:hypothetical protein